ncbi:MAG: hypothetical protein M0031_06160 [Thermaerobacter sp.]|nr:hypothetical protein [Thermaerobacter sp.]
MAEDLDNLRKAYAKLKQQIQEIGFICKGSVVKRYMPCGKRGCSCQADPPQLHGPYYQWTCKIKGKTKTVRLSGDAGPIYENCMNNRRRLRDIIEQMEDLSMKAISIKLEGKS